ARFKDELTGHPPRRAWPRGSRARIGREPSAVAARAPPPRAKIARLGNRQYALEKFLQISKPAQAGFSPRCDTCAGLGLSAPLFLPIEVPQFGMDPSVVLPQPADIAGLLLADHLAVLELPLERDDLGS